MITIYHNPRCKKSRAGLQYLEDKGADFEIKKLPERGCFGSRADRLTDEAQQKTT